MPRFSRFDLRTSDADAARRFYSKVLGHERAVIWPLHEQAVARGAKPHWLGTIGVDEVEQTAEAFAARGAERLGPTRPAAGGGLAAVLRDPGGALLAVGSRPAVDENPGVVWHVLNTRDSAQALKNYAELFGWQPTTRVETGAHGAFQQFAWEGLAAAGAIGDVALRPGVHPHWLFFFEVGSLDEALASARSEGGLVLEPMALPNGARVCVCDDPQGAAFALRERPR
jgi:predicted enzyme related to lactoylglutathione lyase